VAPAAAACCRDQGGCSFDLRFDLVHAGLDVFFSSCTVHNRSIIFVDDDFFCLTQHAQVSIL
jgi:hypothetical protein